MTASPLEKPTRFSLVMNLVPVANLLCGAAAVLVAGDWKTGLAVAAVWIYLLPPAVCRATLALAGTPGGELTQETRAYKVWWFLTQLQMVFNRVHWLEDALRMVPGLYQAWIGLWGGKLSQLAYVAPGVVIVDRYLVDVRAGAVLGYGCTLASHAGTRRNDGRYVVLVGPVTVEEEAIVGGFATLGPGAVLRAGQVLPATRHIAPFDEWPRRPRRTESP